METKPKETLESKSSNEEPKSDQNADYKYRDKDWKDFYFVTL
jgi:hypothetical protein